MSVKQVVCDRYFPRLLFVAALASTICLVSGGYAKQTKQRIVVYAASSMMELFSDAAAVFTSRTGIEVGFEFGSSGALARKIEAGAPADIFVSANEKWVDYTVEKKLLAPGSKIMFARNRLVFSEPVNSPSGITTPQKLVHANLLSIGDPSHVPAGQYARQVLEHFDLWNRLMDQGKLVLATDVRAVLVNVEQGEVTGGIVYSTDALASKKVRTVFTFPEDSHDPITYYGGIVAASTSADAAEKFITFTRGETFAGLLKKYGFQRP